VGERGARGLQTWGREQAAVAAPYLRVVPEVTGGAGAGGLEGLTGVTFGYMKWCERIYPKRRSDRAIPYAGQP
jgi:hypothetical protein